MWREQYRPRGEEDGGFFVVRGSNADDFSQASYTLPLPSRLSRPVGVYDVYEGPGARDDDAFTIVTEVVNDGDSVAHHWVKASDALQGVPMPINSSKSEFTQRAFLRHIKTFQNGNIKRAERDQIKFKDDEADNDMSKDMAMLYGRKTPIVLACFVRLLLIAHNVLTVWRVTNQYNENMYWLMVIANFFLMLEGMVVITRRAGIEYSWWCPCFLIYLASTIPAIWLLQLDQHDRFVNAGKGTTTVPIPMTMTSTTPAQSVMTSSTVNVTSNLTTFAGNTTNAGLNDSATTQFINTTLVTTPVPDEPVLGTLDNDVWVIIIEESLVYLLVFSRWLLPRGKVSRDFLADLLLEFLAIASDIMELLAVFDQDEIRGNLNLTYAIMAVWSASFIQFIPILMQRKRFRKVRNPNVECLTRYFGDKFVEILVTCMSIFLQDLPFLIVRMYIIVKVNLITYSLIFFVLKNIVSLLLLFYRLGILFYRLPHCKGGRAARSVT